jgi:hypothetical protein
LKLPAIAFGTLLVLPALVLWILVKEASVLAVYIPQQVRQVLENHEHCSSPGHLDTDVFQLAQVLCVQLGAVF